ncbi:MFS transporter [Actinophytocola algeriensis]|uniref:Putative MFS family arabinose efflux permease n=1 Tax=Actinophytocola algeriensis TaxID=1768010 RepID=A0A7W7VF24_9PSEU|nr:MFS transporter [Actinophytocola algeriensis]MBB4907873.1 putative MFS family arabinose efflux permease [Actinophytocola algeriensis]MBE1479903.1 putative MFS family arabinose efflux permease [Actinophytocola algeriensis]
MSNDVEQSSPALTGSLRLLQVGAFTSQFDRLMIAPMLVVIAAEMDQSVEAVSVAAAIYLLCYGLAQIGWAMVSDRLGRVRTMRLALLLAMIGGLASAAVPDILWLVVARGLTGACFAAAIPGGLVYVGDTVPVKVRQAPLTDLMTASAIGMTMATVGAGIIADFASWRVAFALTAVVAGLLSFFMRRMTEPELGPPPRVWGSLKGVLTNRAALLVLALVLAEGLVLLGPLTFLPVVVHSSGLSVTLSGLLTAAYGASVLVFARVVKARTAKVAPAMLILTGGTMAVLAYVLLVITHVPAAVVVGTVFLGGGWAFMHSTLQTWATDMAPGYRATAISLFATLLFTGSAIGAAVFGSLVDSGRFTMMFAITLAVSVPLVVTATLGRRRYATKGH